MDLKTLSKNIEFIFNENAKSNKNTYISSVLKNLCNIVNADYVIFAREHTSLSQVNHALTYKTDFVCTSKNSLDNFQFEIVNESSINRILKNGNHTNSSNCNILYPEDSLIQRYKAKAFIGSSIQTYSQINIGVITLLYTTPLNKGEAKLYNFILDIFKQRFSSEIQSFSTEKKLKIKINQMQTQVSTFRDKILKQEKYASLGRIVFGVAHEFETPIKFLNTAATMLSDLNNELEELAYKSEGKIANTSLNTYNINHILYEYSHTTNIIEKHAQKLKSLSLHISQQFSGERFIEIDLKKTIEELLHFAIYSSEIKKEVKDFKIQRDIQLSQRYYVLTSDINSVIMGLLENALLSLKEKYKNTDQHAQLKISCIEEGDELKFSIYDNGSGINTEHLSQEYFTLSEQESSILITDEIIKKNHGKFNVDSKLGKYESFTFKLPQSHNQYGAN